MKLKKVWMSPETKKKSHFFLGTTGVILGIVLLTVLLIFTGSILIEILGLSKKVFSLFLCIGVTILGVYLAIKTGQRSLQNTTVFFLTEEDRLFVLDVRTLVCCGNDFISYQKASGKIQTYLRKLSQKPFLPRDAHEIIKVNFIKENRNSYVLNCQIKYQESFIEEQTFFLIKGYEEEELLLYQLERRKTWENTIEPPARKTLFYIMFSCLGMVLCGGVCALSHPMVEKLPQEIYFPFLALAYIFFSFFIYFIVRYRRGK